jgi:hypothetical protein
MNRRTSLRLRLLSIGRDYDERQRANVQRFEVRPVTRRPKRTHANAEGQAIVLLAFLLLVMLWMNFGPHSRFLMR